MKDKGALKPGQVVKIPVTAHISIKVIVYVILPDANMALKDFFLHKGIIKAL
jgi:hypothetical protein